MLLVSLPSPAARAAAPTEAFTGAAG